MLHYLRDTQRAALDHLDPPRHFDRAENMVLDAVTVRNLELRRADFFASGAERTLIGILDQTATGMGGRLLRQRLLRPSLDREEIEARLDAVSDLVRETILRAELRKQLAPVLDIERLVGEGDDRERGAAGIAGVGPVAAIRCRNWRRRRGARRRISARLAERSRGWTRYLRSGRESRGDCGHASRDI